jgi:uncharacterized cupin superfamily protein
MSTRRHPHIVSLETAPTTTSQHGEKFAANRKRLAAAAGARAIGCSWFEVPPGKQAFPHHAHLGNEEAFYILSGKGEVRLGEERFPVAAGDFIACPPALDTAHSILNTGDVPLTYLGISTASGTDVIVYPDSKKFAAAAGGDVHKGLLAAPFFKLVKDQPSVDYFLDEE